MADGYKAAMQIMEVLSRKIGVEIHDGALEDSYQDLMMRVGSEIEDLGEVAETRPELVADSMLDVAVACVLAVTALANSGEEVSEPETQQMINVEEAAERARRMMIERARKSGIVITDDIDNIH